MMADSEDYKSRLNAYTQGRDYLQMLRESPGVIVDLIRGVPDEVLHRSPAAGKWSIAKFLDTWPTMKLRPPGAIDRCSKTLVAPSLDLTKMLGHRWEITWSRIPRIRLICIAA